MKKIVYILLILSFCMTNAQVPNSFSFRSIVTDKENKPLSEEQITVEIRILDAETENAKTLYFEIHHLQTNKIGGYHLQIGKGKPQKDYKSLDDIDWTEAGEHYINVKVFKEGNLLISDGTSRLQSVPFALVAKNVINENGSQAIDCFENIQDLRDYNAIPSNGDIACVAGHTSFRDGGEGFFYYVGNLKLEDDYGIIIKPDTLLSTDPGRWVRHIDGYININYYGVKGGNQQNINNDGTTEDLSDVIQRALDYTARNTPFDHAPNSPLIPYPPEEISEYTKGNTVFFPNGEYRLNKPLIVKNGANIIGEQNTQFTAISGLNDYMIKIGDGPIQTNIESIILNGNNQSSTGGIHFKAQVGTVINTSQGGLWRSNFKDIEIVQIDGNGIYLEGGDNNTGNYNEPNQFNVFQNVIIKRTNNSSYCLKTTGQLGQHTFINCTFDGKDIDQTGINVELNQSSNVVSFINCSFQSSEYGIKLSSCQSVTIDNCWFENLKLAIDVKSSSKPINIINSRFANACGYGSLKPTNGGRCITSENSYVNIENNYVLVTTGPSVTQADLDDAYLAKFILGVGNNNVINSRNNGFQDIGLSKTFGILQTTTISSNTINIDGKKLVFVNSTGTINKINSTISAGETIFIRANGGTLTINNMGSISGRNIFLAGQSSIILANGQAATFMKIDNVVNGEPATYQLISVNHDGHEHTHN